MHRDLIPISGAGGGGGKGGGSGGARSPIEAPDSLRSVQYARVLNVICEGEIEEIVGGAMGIFCDDTPLANPDGSWNFTGAGIEWRSGTPHQTPVTGFSATESEAAVGVAVTAMVPVVRTVSNPNINAIRVTLGFPQLTNTSTTTGDMTGTTVQLAIDVQRNGAGFVQVCVDTVLGKTTSRYQRSYRIMLSRFGVIGGTYDVRVRRLTPDSTTAYVLDAFNWESMTEIVDSQLSYPYSALVGVQFDASTFQQIPKLSFDVKMRRIQVPSNYDPPTRTYTGVWDGTFKVAWSDCPAWVLYDLATTARFGLGDYLSPAMVDKWTLYDIAKYCDALVPDGNGGWEPRYTINCYIQERADAINLLQQIASVFNAMLFWSGGMLTVTADKPADPIAEFVPANTIDGAFHYVGTPLNQRHTTALVSWNDPANKFAQALEYVEDWEGVTQWGIRELQIQAFGCTSRGQAHRVGKWALLTEKLLSETIGFKSGINAALVRPGDIFLTTDPTRAGSRAGGRVLAVDGLNIKLDAPVTLRAGVTYSLSVLLPNGALETRPLKNGPGTPEAVTVESAFSVPPSRMSVWAMSATDAQLEQWRCISASEDEDGNMEIGGIAYRPDKFAAIENNLILQPIQISPINPFAIGPCTELNVTESKYQISPVVIGARATFSWLAPLGAVRYLVAWSFEDDTPTYDTAFSASVDIQPTKPGMWHFSVWAVNAIGIQSAVASLDVELFGLNQPPEDVKGFQLDIYNDAANLTWRPAEALDVIVGGQVVIRFSTQMSTKVLWQEANEIGRFAGAQSNGFVPLMKGTYLAKFVNSSGKYSLNPAYIVSTTGPLRDYNLVEDLRQDPGFAGERVNTEVRNGVLFISQNEEGYAVSTQAAYYFDRVIDMSKVYTVRCQSYIDGALYGLFNDVDTWPDWDNVLDVDGEKVDEGGGVVMASLTNVDPATAVDTDWSAYTRLVVSDLTFRAARFALVLSVQDNTKGIGVTALGVFVDVPDRLESRNNTPISADGETIEFTVPFKDVPAISIIAQGLQTGDKWLIDQQTPAGFRIRFQDADGDGIAKTCDWIARGYGFEHTDLDGVGALALATGDLGSAVDQRRRTSTGRLTS
jgi:predicted phage tail protein